MVTGGCCHDYGNQKNILSEGISARANVKWTIVHEGGSERDHQINLYGNPDWADAFDVVVHNECFGAVSDPSFIDKVLKPHFEGTPAVVIHCTMHTFRSADYDEWRKFLGVTSRRHEGHRPFEVKNVLPAHPIMKGFPESWKTPAGELYIIEKIWPQTVALGSAYGQDTQAEQLCVWANEYGKGRVFGTTIGHHNSTMSDPVYLDLLARGLLWACGKLELDGTPMSGYDARAVRPSE